MSSPNTQTLTLSDPQSLQNLAVLAHKALKLDAQALIRVRLHDDHTDSNLARLWATTPFGPIGCRTMAIGASPDDAVMGAETVVKSAVAAKDGSAPSAGHPVTLDAGTSLAASWPGSLPPEDGWMLADFVPAMVFRKLEKQARAEATRSSGPLGLPTSLLDQVVLQVESRGDSDGVIGGSADAGTDTGTNHVADGVASSTGAEITMRDVFALCALGFIPAEPDINEPVRISTRGRWHRLDGRFGSVYASEGFGVIPV